MQHDVITQIALDDLHESPFNPRRMFVGLDELAASIRAEGRIHEPLLVRPRVGPLFEGDPNAVAGYEVVFGHRRLRAAALAGLATAPCMVRAMSDAEARSAQTAENLQREDVHPIEEAEGFHSLMTDDGLTAEDVVARVGKSRSYVYGRLKLLQACPEVRQACLDGKIGSEVALLVARLRTAKLQEKALAAIRNDTSSSAKMDDGGKRSYRHIRDLLVEKFTLDLKAAIFDPADPTLCPAAGTCSTCPKRSGNAPEFEDLAAPVRDGEHRGYYRAGGPDICTEPDCFAEKKAAHLARKATEAAKDGAIVISGNKAKAAIGADGRLKGGYVPLKDVQAALKKHAPKGTPTPQVVTIIDQRTGKAVKAVKTDTLPAAAQPQARSPRGRDYEAERRERETAVRAETERRAALHAQIRPRMLAAEPSATELRLVVWLSLQGLDWQVEERALARHGLSSDTCSRHDFAWLDALAPDTLRVLLMDLLLDLACECDYQPETRRDLFDLLARLYGVPTDGASTPLTAGAGADQGEPAAAKGKARPAARAGVKYADVATGSTWSGRGLQPAWVKAALRAGKTLDDLAVEGEGQKAKVDAGLAGDGGGVHRNAQEEATA